MEFFYPSPVPALLYTLLAGIVIGVVYDLLLIKRAVLRTPTPFLVAEDIAFCILSYILLAVFVLKANFGLMRWYEIFCPFVSFALYRVSFGHLTVTVGTAIISFAIKLLKFVLKFFVKAPAKWIFKCCRRLFAKLFAGLLAMQKKGTSLKRKRKLLAKAKEGFKI